MNKPTIEELEAQVKQLAAQLELSVAAERAWETTMMRVCGEDGVGSVADKFKRMAIDAECYKRAMEASNERLVQLAAETSGFHAVQVEMSAVTDEDYEQCPKRVQDVIRHLSLVQIPAYNDFLASLRAEGVDGAIERIMVHTNHQHAGVAQALHILRMYAAQLRSKSEVPS